MKRTERNFWLDVGIFVTCLAATLSGVLLWLVVPHQAASGLPWLNRSAWLTVHICSGLASLAGCILHVAWHRLWLRALRGRRIASLPAKIRANRVMDRFVWISFIALNVFGTLDWILPTDANGASILGRLHLAWTLACLLGIVVHLVLHYRWIAAAIKRNFLAREQTLETGQAVALPDLESHGAASK